MRNESVTLNVSELAKVCAVSLPIWEAIASATPVVIDYITRDGSPKRVEGVPLSMLGEESTLSVVVDTERGPRTVNLARATMA